MAYQRIEITRENQILIISLSRPEKRNAMDGLLIQELSQVFSDIAQDDSSRIVLIKGNGEHFCAGADIEWMQKIAVSTANENEEDAKRLADMLYQLYALPKPILALAQGATMGGGLGLLAASDIVIASKGAYFSFPEVKLGITPAVISPYVVAAIGKRMASYYFLTGERFSAEKAEQMGLIHHVTEKSDLYSTAMTLAAGLLRNSPFATSAAKKLIREISMKPVTRDLVKETARQLAELRKTKQAQEGLRAFLEKRSPEW